MKIVSKLFVLVFLGFNISSVYAVTVNSDESIKEIIEDKIDGKDMEGMQVTVNGTSTATWNGISASDTGWELAYIGTDTLSGRWKFTNKSSEIIDSVMFDAFGADAVFDSVFDPSSEGTENSAAGNFKIHNSSAPNHKFTGPVKIAGSETPVGDIFRGLEFDFSNVGGLSQNESVAFTIDSDKFAPVPLPSAVILLFSGLLGLVGLRHRQ